MDIRFLNRSEIDKVKWNSCVHYANNGNVFGYVWYLDQVAKEWDALVEGDYESVFPLVWRKRSFGGKELYQPPLMRELGVFSIHVLSAARIQAFLEAIPAAYQHLEIDLNEQNFLKEAEGFHVRPNTNHQLLLTHDYESLSAAYRPEMEAHLKKAQKAGLRSASAPKPEAIADFYRKHYSGPGKDRNFHAMQRIMYNVMHRGWGFSSGVENPEGQLLAANFFIFSHGKMLSLVPTVSAAGREAGALAFLFDLVLRSQATRPLLLDFNGQSPELALEMGARPNTFLRLNRSPGFFSRLSFFESLKPYL